MQEKPPPPSEANASNPSGGSPYATRLGSVVGLSAAGIGFLGALWLAGPRVAGLLANTAAVAIPASLASLAIGLPLGWLIAKTDLRGRGVALVLLLTLTLLPLHVLAAGWLTLLSPQSGAAPNVGWFAGLRGAIGLHAVAGVPWATILSAVAFLAVDRRREEQALLDVRASRVVLGVTLREAAPAIVAGGMLLAVLVSSEMAITDLLLVRTFAEEVYTQAAAGQLAGSASGDGAMRLFGGVAALGIVGAVAMVTLLGRLRPALSAERPQPWRLRPPGGAGLTAVLLLVTGGLVGAPLVSLAHQAGVSVESTSDGTQREWTAAKTVSAVASAPWQHRRELGVSLSLAAVVATSCTLLGAAAGWRLRERRWQGVAAVSLALLLATPGPVWGLLTIRCLNQPLDSPVWWLGELYGTWFAPWLAQTVRLTPYAVLIAWPAMKLAPTELLDAARADGAGLATRLLRIAGPLVAPALAAVWLIVFAMSVGELSATVLCVPPGTPPLSVRLLSLLHYGVEDRVAAICLVLMLGALVIGGGVIALLTRRAG